jgi:organic radical activating enzyme
MSPWDVALWVSEHPEGIRWVMLTGGEPAEQDTRALVAALHRAGKKVALETSGTATGHLSPNSRDATCDWVCVSPKWQIPGSPHRPIIPEAVLSADELKFPVGRREDVEKVHRFLDTFAYRPDCEVCLQPLSMSKKATDLVLEVCQQEGWRASIQVHKYLRLK